MSDIPPSLVYAAHVDSWQAHGRVFEGAGGGVALCPGLRLMASGLPYDYLNTACVVDDSVADIECARRWFGERGLPWGVLVPAGTRWQHGTRLLSQHLMAVVPKGFIPPRAPYGLELAAARPEDIDAVVAVDSAAFGSELDAARAWLAPLCRSDAVEVAVALYKGAVVGTGYATTCEGDAGFTVYLGGIGVVPAARGRGVGSALSSWLVERGLERGAGFAHLQTESDAAARVYSALGFRRCGGIDIYANR